MPNTQPWEYQENEIRHATTGAIGAKTPQGDIVYGPLAKQYLTPIESVPKIIIPEAEAPATAPGMSLIDRTPESWLLDQQRQLQENIATQQKQLEETQAERKGLIDQAKDFFSTVPKMEKSARNLQQEFGITKTLELQEKSLADAMALRNQAILLSEQRDGAIAALGQQGTLTPFISRQQAVIAESYDRRINTLAAQEATQIAMFQAQQGQIQQARGLVSDIVNAMTYDTNLELTKMQTFLDINRDEISMLDTSIQRDLQETTRQIENQLKEEKAERTAVLEMMLQYRDSGISANDTLEDATVKAQQWLNIQPDARVEDLMIQFPTAGIDSKDTFAEAITKIARMPQAPAGTPKTPQVFGGQQTGYFSWTQDAQGNWVPQQVVGGTGVDDPIYINPDINEPMSIYETAKWIVENNPNLSDEELRLSIRENVKGLNETDIQNIISTSRLEPTEEEVVKNSTEYFTYWKDLGLLKKDAEAQWRVDHKWHEKALLPEPERSILEKIYTPDKKFWEFWK